MKLFYKIKEVAELLGENESTLRYWEDEFPEEIKPARNKRGVRLYNEQDINNVRMVHYYIRDCGFTLEGVRKKFKNNIDSAANQAKVVMRLKKIKDELKALGEAMEEAEKITV